MSTRGSNQSICNFNIVHFINRNQLYMEILLHKDDELTKYLAKLWI